MSDALRRKRDLPNIARVDQLRALLNRFGAPEFEAVAFQGHAVRDTLAAAIAIALRRRGDWQGATVREH